MKVLLNSWYDYQKHVIDCMDVESGQVLMHLDFQEIKSLLADGIDNLEELLGYEWAINAYLQQADELGVAEIETDELLTESQQLAH